jgi:hypothetical protein
MIQTGRKYKTLDEGIAMLTLDYVLAIRIIKYLWQNYDQTPAFKAGIIDAEGKKIKDPETTEEKSAYSPFVRLVLRLKKLIGMVPGGKTKIGSMIAAYALMREGIQNKEEAEFLDEVLAPVFAGKMNLMESLSVLLLEDGEGGAVASAPVNTTVGATSSKTGGYDVPLGKKILKRASVVNNTKPISVLKSTVEKREI